MVEGAVVRGSVVVCASPWTAVFVMVVLVAAPLLCLFHCLSPVGGSVGGRSVVPRAAALVMVMLAAAPRLCVFLCLSPVGGSMVGRSVVVLASPRTAVLLMVLVTAPHFRLCFCLRLRVRV